MSYNYDLFVIGAGSGGIAAARRAAGFGAKVAIAEGNRLGGTCVNRGCIPKKLMVYASHFPALFHDAKGYGWSGVESSFNWQTMITGINNELARLNGVYRQMLETSGVELFSSYAKIIDLHTIEIDNRQVTTDKILIAVGGYPVKPDIPGIEYTITSDDMFLLQSQPKHIAIMGGGYIGVEFACIMNGLGSQVTQLIRRDLILRGFDDDIRTMVQESTIQNGIRIIKVNDPPVIEKTPDGLNVILGDTHQETIPVDAVLTAVGRKPNIKNLGLENAGVEIKNGAIAVNRYSQTSQPNIFAVGDCTDRMNLTPVAINEGRAFADTEFGGKSRTMSYDNIPTAVFSTPEVATVGLRESEANEKFGEEAIKVYRAKFKPTYHGMSGRDARVMVKLVVEAKTDKVLGAHIVGENAAEIIQGIAIALKMGAKKSDFDATVGLHPSIAEEFVTLR
ncbi:MAG TPA: glutathione-disulfide reductase [Cyanobacteria bacterium UBA11149]|nr:glutathione-disulfide reductase [Cyanobacteria bacterium UBA11367]HBE58164.1 glutathione-disulfide reductase [Cyanobacteria bacterium UBA11366]HBK62161.1 glutathione-disulfide reductase [Cyanobacteria bacterium UBA11166]HBR74395.1 glutathione-disulfide reductase [Cyanobacteria bacterium UBA11159]HBS69500.1 glutathione-disulfide reductase [Cyanobacteria bacterium UBA11153]HBW88108.1 glutathione-disulfide reductase [Cyanobacteria bacterium UBA11149]HCA94408.1 glutathione-disulfide reductase 